MAGREFESLRLHSTGRLENRPVFFRTKSISFKISPFDKTQQLGLRPYALLLYLLQRVEVFLLYAVVFLIPNEHLYLRQQLFIRTGL